ncbi:MAG: tRNA (uridine(34)/cytosine(34)/5-carboxymethylaminomethyluridine(34)-2'-O)-methyltransferase TrmL [Clostridiales bacterium]|nr:tRNA (uridine(34)/cytosine(34)/5-carboxymethylaminomethyluridine(34)-2'-O)-methyltransferase TrmL [Clostridiales bacterium]
MAFNVVLVEPEIPQNAGNIARTCAVTGSKLHLVRPLGFEVSDKYLKRAGLDYWNLVEIFYYDSIEEVMDKFYNGNNFHFFSTKSKVIHSDANFNDGDFLVFGKETKGLPESLLEKHYDECVRIPMMGETRSLNLSNSVCVGVYEGLRQLGYPNFKTEGEIPQK